MKLFSSRKALSDVLNARLQQTIAPIANATQEQVGHTDYRDKLVAILLTVSPNAPVAGATNDRQDAPDGGFVFTHELHCDGEIGLLAHMPNQFTLSRPDGDCDERR